MSNRQVTNEELIARVEACQENGNTLGGGAVAPEAVAEALPISASTAAEYLRRLAKRDEIEPTWGFDDGKQRRGYRPLETEAESRRVMADGGESPGCTENETETIQMTDDGLVMPEKFVGYTGQLVVEWPSMKMQKQTLSLVEPGIPKLCDYICRGIMPSEEDANGVPGGHLRIDGTLYEIEDARTEGSSQ